MLGEGQKTLGPKMPQQFKVDVSCYKVKSCILASTLYPELSRRQRVSITRGRVEMLKNHHFHEFIQVNERTKVEEGRLAIWEMEKR